VTLAYTRQFVRWSAVAGSVKKSNQLAHIARAMLILTGSICEPIIYFLVSGPKFTNYFCLRDCSRSNGFPIFDILIRFRDIRDRSVKLPKSSWILEVFALRNFRGAVPPKVVPEFSCQDRGTLRGKVSSGYAPWPQSYWRAYAEF